MNTFLHVILKEKYRNSKLNFTKFPNFQLLQYTSSISISRLPVRTCFNRTILILTLANIEGSASTTAVKHFMALVRTATAVSQRTFNICKRCIKTFYYLQFTIHSWPNSITHRAHLFVLISKIVYNAMTYLSQIDIKTLGKGTVWCQVSCNQQCAFVVQFTWRRPTTIMLLVKAETGRWKSFQHDWRNQINMLYRIASSSIQFLDHSPES